MHTTPENAYDDFFSILQKLAASKLLAVVRVAVRITYIHPGNTRQSYAYCKTLIHAAGKCWKRISCTSSPGNPYVSIKTSLMIVLKMYNLTRSTETASQGISRIPLHVPWFRSQDVVRTSTYRRHFPCHLLGMAHQTKSLLISGSCTCSRPALFRASLCGNVLDFSLLAET